LPAGPAAAYRARRAISVRAIGHDEIVAWYAAVGAGRTVVHDLVLKGAKDGDVLGPIPV
jgi:hypothetical protein